MKRSIWLVCVVAVAVGLAVPTASLADTGTWLILEDHSWCGEDDWDERHCEVREIILPADRKLIAVDGGNNGGIEVEGWDRDEIRLRVKVKVWADDREEAEEIASEIEIVTDDRTIHAEGPNTNGKWRRRGWAVSYRLMVPKESNLDLETNNGGIDIVDVSGDIRFSATNGGIALLGLGGDVKGHTTNGGITVELLGDGWKGDGLNVSTTNGGVSVAVPETYNAELETGTVNGGIHVDFPIMVQGNIKRNLNTTLGDGGARIRVKTTNGGVHITHDDV